MVLDTENFTYDGVEREKTVIGKMKLSWLAKRRVNKAIKGNLIPKKQALTLPDYRIVFQ